MYLFTFLPLVVPVFLGEVEAPVGANRYVKVAAGYVGRAGAYLRRHLDLGKSSALVLVVGMVVYFMHVHNPEGALKAHWTERLP